MLFAYCLFILFMHFVRQALKKRRGRQLNPNKTEIYKAEVSRRLLKRKEDSFFMHLSLLFFFLHLSLFSFFLHLSHLFFLLTSLTFILPPTIFLKVPLRQFSGWLSDFDAATNRIEIPGQYIQTGCRSPNVENHAMLGKEYSYIYIF